LASSAGPAYFGGAIASLAGVGGAVGGWLLGSATVIITAADPTCASRCGGSHGVE